MADEQQPIPPQLRRMERVMGNLSAQRSEYGDRLAMAAAEIQDLSEELKAEKERADKAKKRAAMAVNLAHDFAEADSDEARAKILAMLGPRQKQ